MGTLQAIIEFSIKDELGQKLCFHNFELLFLIFWDRKLSQEQPQIISSQISTSLVKRDA